MTKTDAEFVATQNIASLRQRAEDLIGICFFDLSKIEKYI